MSYFKVIKICLIIFMIAVPLLVQAQILPPCTATGNCGVCDFVQTFINIVRWFLGILGGTALFLMVWHGFTWLSSMGNKEKIESGQKGLIHTVLGMIIVLGAWFVVNASVAFLMTPKGADKPVQKLFNTAGDPLWYEACQEGEGQKFCQQGHGEGTPCGYGKFCLMRNNVMTCDYTGKKGVPLDNACHYWHAHPDRYEYRGYFCVTDPANCQQDKTLGAGFCSNDKELCCEPIDPKDETVVPFTSLP